MAGYPWAPGEPLRADDLNAEIGAVRVQTEAADLSRQGAEAAKTAAETARDQAAAATALAQAARDQAASSAAAASGAVGSATAAASSATDAAVAQTAAAVARTGAETARQAADDAAHEAGTYQAAAALDRQAAQSSATNANNASLVALASATNAVNAADIAVTAGTNAEASATTAQTKAGEAATSATAAASSAALAADVVADLPLTFDTLAQLQASPGTADRQRATVNADPLPPALANPDGTNRNGEYFWNAGTSAWVFDGPSAKVLGVGVTGLQSIISTNKDAPSNRSWMIVDPDGNIAGYLTGDARTFAIAGVKLHSDADGSCYLEAPTGQRILVRNASGLVSVSGVAFDTVPSDTVAWAIADLDGNILFGVRRDGTLITVAAQSSDTLSPAQQAIVNTLADKRIAAKVIGPVDSRRIAFNGDSITDHATDDGPSIYGWNARGWAAWMLALSGRRLVSEMSDNYAVAGSQSSAILTRAPIVAAGGYGWVGQLGGSINDLIHDVPADTTIANWIAAAEVYLTAGARFLCTPILPHGAGAWVTDAGQSEADQRKKLAYINGRIAAYARSRLGIVWVDPRDRIVDQTTGDLLPWSTYDGTHTTPQGAYWPGRLAAEAISAYLPAGGVLTFDPLDLFDATANRYGNILTNGMMAGTGGTLGPNHSGQVATGWASGLAAAGTPTGGTIVWSKENPRSDGKPGERQVVTLTGVTGSGVQTQQYLSQVIPLSSGRYSVGDVLEGTAEVEVLAGSRGILQAGLRVQENNGSTTLDYRDMGNYGSNPLPAEPWAMSLKTPRFTVRASTTGTPTIDFRLSLYADLTVASGAALVAKFARVSLNKVA